MQNLYYFLAILVPVLGIFVTVIIAVIKFSRNSVTKDDLKSVKDDLRDFKDDLSNKIDALRSEMNRRFEEAAVAREKIRDEAAAERKQIKDEAAAERKQIKDEAAADRQLIRIEVMEARKVIADEMSRQNQNYIEHLVYHNTRKSKPESEEEDST